MAPKGNKIIALARMMLMFVSTVALILQDNLTGLSGFGFIQPLVAGLVFNEIFL